MPAIKVTNSIDDFDIELVNTEGRYTVTIKKYNGNSKEIIVPDTIGGIPVTAIGDDAFSWNDKLTNIILPEGIVSIGSNSFTCCSNLEEIKLPQSLVSIGWAFEYCEKLINLSIPRNTISIKYAFSNCSSLNEIVIDEHNPVYASSEGVLFNKDRTTLLYYPHAKEGDYIVPDLVHSIGRYAFDGCKGLTSIRFPMEFIRCSASFSECERLTKFMVHENSKDYSSTDGVLFFNDEAGSSLFWYPRGKSNKKYTVPAVVNWITSSAFCNCKKLTNIILPEGLEGIDDMAFSGCDRLSAITLPMSLEYIGEDAFYECLRLETITLSRKTKIAHRAFDGFSGKLIYRD